MQCSAEAGADDTNERRQLVLIVYCGFSLQVWLPVRLVQGRIENEIKNNLAAVRQHTEGLYMRRRAGSRT